MNPRQKFANQVRPFPLEIVSGMVEHFEGTTRMKNDIVLYQASIQTFVASFPGPALLLLVLQFLESLHIIHQTVKISRLSQRHANESLQTHPPPPPLPAPPPTHFRGNSLNTLLKISLDLYRLLSLNLSLSKCALSLACPQGKCAAGASNSFSKNLILGIEPPSLIYNGFLPLFFSPFPVMESSEGSTGVAARQV